MTSRSVKLNRSDDTIADALHIEDTRKALWEVCKDFGDTEWDERLYLPDVITKHLEPYIQNKGQTQGDKSQGFTEHDLEMEALFSRHRLAIQVIEPLLNELDPNRCTVAELVIELESVRQELWRMCREYGARWELDMPLDEIIRCRLEPCIQKRKPVS